MSEQYNDTTKQLPEAPASATMKVKSPNGFSYLYTVRTDDENILVNRLEMLEEFMLGKGWTPEENYTSGFAKKTASAEPKLPLEDQAAINQVMSEGEGKCEQCQGPATYREGVGKSGKPYKGYFCNNKDGCGHVKWVK